MRKVQETTVEARQGDRRLGNSRVLVWGTAVAILVLGGLALFFALQASG